MELRTLEELNRAFTAGTPPREKNIDIVDIDKLEPITPVVIELEPPRTESYERHESHSKKRRGLFTAISDMLFSLSVFIILAVVLTSGSSGGTPKTILNYSYFNVLTPSMQDEIPQGSLILVKQRIDPLELKIGDNITFMSDRSTSVTHKIVDIYENYDDSGVRGFQTQGVNNANPDRDVVYEANVIGKVVFVLPVAGAVLSYLGENVFVVFIFFGLCLLLSFIIRGIFTKPEKISTNGSIK